MRSRFQQYMRALRWVSKTMIIAERGWHFPQCRYAKLFSKVHASPSVSLENNDYSWEGLTFSSMPLRKIVFKGICETLNDFQKAMIIAERGWHFAQCRYTKSFSKRLARPSMIFKNNDYSWERLTFSSMLLREIVFKSTCEPDNCFRKQWL